MNFMIPVQRSSPPQGRSDKRIDHRNAATHEVVHISSHDSEAVMLSRCSDHCVLDSYGETGASDIIGQSPPDERHIERPIQTINATAQSLKPLFQIRAPSACWQMVDALPNLPHHYHICHANDHVELEPVHCALNGLWFGWLAEQICVHEVSHSNNSVLRSSVVSPLSAGVNQPFSGQASNQSTKSGFEPSAGASSSVNATRTRWPLSNWLSRPAIMPALSSSTLMVV